MVLEQLKNSVPEQVATYITEPKAKAPREAAVLANEYVLTHIGSCEITGDTVYKNDHYSRAGKIKMAGAGFQKFSQGGRSSAANSDTCRYYQARGHWKKECPLLKPRGLLVR